MSAQETKGPGLDAQWHAALGQFTGGLAPASLMTAYFDWSLHLLTSPEKCAELMRLAITPPALPRSNHDDKRFSDPAWKAMPYRQIANSFLGVQDWWRAATSDVDGVDPKHAQIVSFAARQWLDMMSPANSAATNPKVISKTLEERGRNLVRGLTYWIEDFNRLLSHRPRPHSEFKVGETLATTPGDVVLRNPRVELIRYLPVTQKVRPEPILIVPAWIMKYYILDLTDQRSLVGYLRDQGFEVYVVSWKNPGADDAGLSMQDYIDLGVRAPMDFLKTHGAKKVHGVGYCLGGTLLTIAAAAMARDGDDVLTSLSLLASQVDFSEPGEIGLFINESQIAFLEDMMAVNGYLRADQMAGAFRMLRSNDLIWSRVIRHYLLGERSSMNALLAWNEDATRMPAKMHSEYLRRLFLGNDLVKGRFPVDDKPVALTDIRTPIYCVGTEKDHVSPWMSVYRLLLLSDTDVTFALTSGGHNGGIVSEPGHPRRHFRVRHKTEGGKHLTAPQWLDQSKPQDGSWWPHWSAWLKQKSGASIKPRPLPATELGAAPGSYVCG
ncbi:MAG: alpha/beta fold hydrolase [Alphaproteobacteria bacterium]|nr:alpha/beta fold hydrolase [Alphaproteobacteria bacterium]